jgi:hypothetical protein
VSSRGYGLGITGILLLVAERIVFALVEFLWRELLIIVGIPFEILAAACQAYLSISSMITQLEVLGAILSIYHNFTSGLSFPEIILQSISPLGTLIWFGFWGLVFWYIGIPLLEVLFSLLTDHR